MPHVSSFYWILGVVTVIILDRTKKDLKIVGYNVRSDIRLF